MSAVAALFLVVLASAGPVWGAAGVRFGRTAVPTVLHAAIQPTPPPVPPPPPVVPQPGGAPSRPNTPVTDRADPHDDGGVDAGALGTSGHEVVRVGSDYALAAGATIKELVVVMGSATLDGHVDGDVVVTLGEVRLGPTATVGGDVVVVGGSLTVQNGATAAGDVVVVGGKLDAPAEFMPEGEQVVVGFAALAEGVRGVLPWMTGGLLLARPIVPSIPWVWGIVGVLFLVYLTVLLLFEEPVQAATRALSATPLRSFVTGLGVLVMAGPLFLLLAVSVVGLAVVPFAGCAVAAAALIGKIAVARWLGLKLLPEGDRSGRVVAARSLAIGSALLVLAYAVPLLGGFVWAVASATGLGAATLAFAAAYRAENPPIDTHHRATVGEWRDVTTVPDAAPLPSATLLARASFSDRLAAFVLDVALVGLAIALLESLHDDAFVPLFLAYRSILWAWRGATLGEIICQLQVVRADGTPVRPVDAVVRGLGSIFSIAFFGIGCLWVLRDPERQAWHDKLAGTWVIKVPRRLPHAYVPLAVAGSAPGGPSAPAAIDDQRDRGV